MVLGLILNKLKSFILIFVNLFRRALCCFRRRRRSSCDSVPLTHVVSNNEDGLQKWGDWEDTTANNKPKTVQDHIDLYRKQAELSRKQQESPDAEEQTKILINTSQSEHATSQNRLNVVDDSLNVIPTAELREWEDTSGWEGEALDHDAQRALREKKRQDRERRAWEQSQKRQEKMSRSLGSKMST
ncbi:hypothetical protein NQ317_005019 [Molorchus minor]|uniref:Receptor-binding cancer antigen n=1 Tax=Molorchus minor TaxID=1323400 RepID=A0ABQ9K337_9CUCU|nr:hypothetical protein NQ317_005019 [Molorchus minor]